MFKKILVCLDGSKLAEQILPYAMAEAEAFNSHVVLFHVFPPPVIVSPGIPGTSPVSVETDAMVSNALKAESQAQTYLEKQAESMRSKGLRVSAVTLTGQAGPEIIQYSAENGIGLIAIATHGRGGLGRAVFGSVADYVLRTAGLPVLVIRPKEA
jgi:nucleotide-binding universal stress UspA family protein